MYDIKIKGRPDPLRLDDKLGAQVAAAHAVYGETKQDTFLKLKVWQGNASSIVAVEFHDTSVHLDNDYDKNLRERSEDERTALAKPPVERARRFVNGYFQLFHHAIVGERPDTTAMADAIEALTPWFAANPKRLIPGRDVLDPLVRVGRPGMLHVSMFTYYVNALGRDIRQVEYRK